MLRPPSQHGDPVLSVAFVVDDDVSIRSAIASILRSIGLATYEFASADEFLNSPPIDAPGCLVLDIRLPGMSGFTLQAQMLQRQRRIPIVMITGYGDIPMSVRALKAGALDFLTKPFRDQDLIDAVTAAIEADKARRLKDKAFRDVAALHGALTDREREIFDLVCKGMMNKQIAARIGVSEITVKVRRGLVMKKMQARTLPDLVRIAETLKAGAS